MDLHALTQVSTLVRHIPFDWIVLGCVFLIMTIDAMRAGPNHAVALSLTLPITAIVLESMAQAPFVGPLVGQFSSSMASAVVTGIVLAILFLLINRMCDTFGIDSGRLVQSILAGAAVTAVLAVVWLQLPAFSALWHPGAHLAAVFGPSYRFWWLMGSYLALAVSKTR